MRGASAIIIILLITSVCLNIYLVNEVYLISSRMEALRKHVNFIQEEVASLRGYVKEVLRELAKIIEILASSSMEVNISSILSNPEAWENKVIIVEGTIHILITIPELKYPYNYILREEDGKKSIGVFWDKAPLPHEGALVRVLGIVKKGYVQKLTGTGWVNHRLVWYIEAIAIKKP